MIVRRTFPTALAIFLLASSCHAAAQESALRRGVALVLLERFDSVLFSNSTLLEGDPGSPTNAVEEATSALRASPFSRLISGFDYLRGGTAQRILKNSSGVFVGARDFMGPTVGMGAVRSTLCYVILLRNRELDSYAHLSRLPTIVLPSGRSALVWEATIGEFGDEAPGRPSPFFAVFLDNFLLVSNSVADLDAVSQGLFAGAKRRNEKGRDYQKLDSAIQYPYWGYRRYGGPATSSANKHASGMVHIHPDAQALVLEVDLHRKTCSLLILTSSASPKTIESLNSARVLPRFVSVGPNLWEAKYSLREKDGDPRSLFVMMLFGFGIYV